MTKNWEVDHLHNNAISYKIVTSRLPLLNKLRSEISALKVKGTN